MTDERPKPRYGEYATPQNQADAVAGDSNSHGAAPQPPTPQPAAPQLATPPSAVPDRAAEKPSDGSWWAPAAADAATHTRPRKRWDLILTVALLAYGALNVFSQVGQYSDITGFLNRMAEQYPVFGTGTFTPTGREAAVGMTINVVNLVLYLGTLLLSVRRLRQRKLTFFVPLIGGAVAAITAAILLSSILASSPGFLGAVSGQ